MSRLVRRIRRLRYAGAFYEQGQTVIEYALVVALASVVLVELLFTLADGAQVKIFSVGLSNLEAALT